MLRTRPTLPSRLSPLLVLLAGLMVSVALTPSLARAQGADTVLWVNPNGGNWSDASNWSPANVPDAVNEVAVMKPLSSAYVVTLDHDATTGGLRIDNGASLIVDGKILTLEGIVINSGALRMIHSATVHVDRPLVQNHGGQIIAGPGGGSLLIKMPFDTGGTLDCTLNGYNTTRGGTLVVDGGDLTLFAGLLFNTEIQRVGTEHAVRLLQGNGQDLEVAAGAELDVIGLLDNTPGGRAVYNYGTIRVQGWFNTGCCFVNSTVSIVGDGKIVLEGGILDASGGSTMVNSAGHTITGCGTIQGNIDNEGTIDVDCPSSSFNITAPFVNNGTISVKNGLMWLKGSSTWLSNPGHISTLPGGAIWIDEAATLDNRFGTLTTDGGPVELGRNTSGTIMGGVIDGSRGGQIVTRGVATLRDITIGSGATITAMAGGTTNLTGVQTINQGTLRVQGALNVGSSTDLIQTGGSTILDGGTLTSAHPLQIQAGTLRGIGTIAANVTSGALVSPDAGAGTLHIQGDYAQTAAGRLTVPLAGASAAQYGKLQVDGLATLAGTIEAAAVGGFMPAPGNRFDVLSSGTVSGQFGTLVGNVSSGVFDLMALYDADGVDLVAEAIVGVEPPGQTPAALDFRGQGIGAKATFVLALPKESVVSVRAYDAAGREIGTLAEGTMPPGIHGLPLTGLGGSAPPSGIYFARASVTSGGLTETRTARVIQTR